MLKALHLTDFKSFRSASLQLGPFTTILGTNASGKSNLRDALRFVHGVSRGYTLAEIMGEKWIEGGVLQWRGIRGGTREAAFNGARSFALGVSFQTEAGRDGTYKIQVELAGGSTPPRVVGESLALDGRPAVVFRTCLTESSALREDRFRLTVIGGQPVPRPVDPVAGRLWPQASHWRSAIEVTNFQPVLWQLAEPRGTGRHSFVALDETGTPRLHVDTSDAVLPAEVHAPVMETLDAFDNMRFLDLSPEAMRRPSLPGQVILGDQGENLSSVLQAICQDPDSKENLLEWIQELTPMDVCDLKFPVFPDGKILLTLVEPDDRETSAYSASDGTLRFLAILAALLGPEPARFYFFEELENGIHPSRLHLLLQLIQQTTAERNIQVVATTHSPLFLSLLEREALENASVTYRLPETPDTRIKRVLEIPHARELFEKQEPGHLFASGWMEDVLFLEDEAEAEAEAAA